MGIRKLNKFLKDKNLYNSYGNLGEFATYNDPNKSAYKKYHSTLVIAVDVWLYAHKFTYSYSNMLIGFWNQIIKLVSSRVIPVYIFDGTPPVEKGSVLKFRSNKKKVLEDRLQKIINELNNLNTQEQNDELQKKKDELAKEKYRLSRCIIHITKDDINKLKELLTILHIPFLDASGEADAMCSKLYKDKYISSCLTDDMDMLASGCNSIIKFDRKTVIEYNLDHILKQLRLTYDQFIDMCLLFGCDYLKSVPYINHAEMYELIKQYNTIESIFNSGTHSILRYQNEKCKEFVEKYSNIRQLFLSSGDSEVIPDNFNFGIEDEIDEEEVISFFRNNIESQFVEHEIRNIQNNIRYINNRIVNKFLYISRK